MAVGDLRRALGKAINKNAKALRELQYENSIVHMFFYHSLIAEHVSDVMYGAMAQQLGRDLTRKEEKVLRAKASKRTKSIVTVNNVAYKHQKAGYKAYKNGQLFEKESGYQMRTRAGTRTNKANKAKKHNLMVYVRNRNTKYMVVPMNIALNAQFVVATYVGSMGKDTAGANREVMRTLIQQILDNVTNDIIKEYPVMAGGKSGRGGLKNKTKAGSRYGHDAKGTFARLHGPVSGAATGDAGPNLDVNERLGDTSVPVVGITDILRAHNSKAAMNMDNLQQSAAQHIAKQLDLSFTLGGTTISDIVKFDKVIEIGMALGSGVPGHVTGSQQSMMTASDTDAVNKILDKILDDVVNDSKFTDDFKSSKGIKQRYGEIGSSIYLKEIFNKKWWNKPNMRLRVNKQLVKLGKNEKEMSEALQAAVIAGATRLGSVKNPKKKGGSKRNKPSNDKRVGAAVNKQRQSPIALKNLINSVLPQMVAIKMQPPALRYRTGRFANSARVTQVMQGPRGGLQADYTYMRDPYGTFEPGGKMGSVQRDPRKIIGQTIREIVAQGMQNKFIKTRRV